MTNDDVDLDPTGRDVEGSAKCPFDPSSIDPLAPGQIASPYDALAVAREEAPVFVMPSSGSWCVTRWRDVREVLSNSRVFSSAQMVRRWPPPPETAADLPDGHPMEGALVSIDPPRHDRIRRLAQKAFTPGLVAAREPAIRQIADGLVDRFVDRGSVNLVEMYCSQIPPAVVAQLLGVPPEDGEIFQRWALDAHHLAFSPPHLEPDELLRLSRLMVDFDQYLRALIAARRESPQDDLTSYLVHAETEEGDPQLTDAELRGLIADIVTAGSETTVTLIGSTMYLLLTHPEELAAVTADRTLVPAALEEALRLLPPARALPRTTRSVTELESVEIPEGGTMYASIAAANRDPDVFFPDPDRFDIYRTNTKRHLSLGVGTHFCLGAPLARLEVQVAVDTLLDRIPSLRLLSGYELTDDKYERNAFIPSLASLEVEWRLPVDS